MNLIHEFQGRVNTENRSEDLAGIMDECRRIRETGVWTIISEALESAHRAETRVIRTLDSSDTRAVAATIAANGRLDIIEAVQDALNVIDKAAVTRVGYLERVRV